jgi:hypothetical protein
MWPFWRDAACRVNWSHPFRNRPSTHFGFHKFLFRFAESV